jgi:hypothetical protein
MILKPSTWRLTVMLSRFRYRLEDRWHRWKRPKYPRFVVDYGPNAPMHEGWGFENLRTCGHFSRSFAYDPLREETLCLNCYRRAIGHKREVR